MTVRARPLRWVTRPMAFAVGFALACAGLDRLVEPIRAGGGKVEWFRDHGAGYDALFVGSSRTARGVVPSVFDGAMAEAGRPVRSFNLALPGMWPPEDGYVIERALERRDAPLAFLIVECNALRLGTPPGDQDTSRAVYWHDAERLRALWRRAFAPESASPEAPPDPRAVRQNLEALAEHVRYFAWNAARLGRGAELLRDALGAKRTQPAAPALGPAGDGYAPRRSRAPLRGEALAVYEQELRRATAGRERHSFADVESQAELRRKRALAERYGARLVLVAPPITGGVFAPLPELGAAFLDFSDPARVPELFAPEHRKDGGHLNALGAELYSRLLARGIAALR